MSVGARLALAVLAGLVLLGALGAASRARAATDRVILQGTVVRLLPGGRPGGRPGALAEVELHNRNVNDAGDEGRFELAIPGLAVAVEFDWDHFGSEDAVRVTPPEGVVCLPADCLLVVPEDGTGRLFLFAATGVGM